MKLVILGCGRVGARLAQLMEAEGHSVSIIDSDPAAFARLPESFQGQTILGTGIDVDVLKTANLAEADAFAAVTNFDNTNIMASEVAKEIFGVKQVLARIYDPAREDLYHHLGLETVCPTTLVSTAAHNILLAGQSGQEQAAEPSAVTRALSALPAQDSAGTAPIQQSQPRLPVGNDADKAAQNGRSLRGIFKH